MKIRSIALHHLQQDFCEVELHQDSYRPEGAIT
jgi:hypothetical protein